MIFSIVFGAIIITIVAMMLYYAFTQALSNFTDMLAFAGEVMRVILFTEPSAKTKLVITESNSTPQERTSLLSENQSIIHITNEGRPTCPEYDEEDSLSLESFYTTEGSDNFYIRDGELESSHGTDYEDQDV